MLWMEQMDEDIFVKMDFNKSRVLHSMNSLAITTVGTKSSNLIAVYHGAWK